MDMQVRENVETALLFLARQKDREQQLQPAVLQVRYGFRLKDAVESIAMTLRYRYLLGYEPSRGGRGWRTIRIEVQRPAAQARARKGYYPGA